MSEIQKKNYKEKEKGNLNLEDWPYRGQWIGSGSHLGIFASKGTFDHVSRYFGLSNLGLATGLY